MTAIAVMKTLESAIDPGYRMETHVEETTVKFDSQGKKSALAVFLALQLNRMSGGLMEACWLTLCSVG